MSSLQNLTNQLKNYYPAELVEGKDWFIKYYIYNPFTNKMERKRVKINRIKSISERKKYARKLIVEINEKLALGWNPAVEQDTTRTFVRLRDAVETYQRVKSKELSINSIRSYNSFIGHLFDWLKDYNQNLYCGEFTKIVASEFMLYIKELERVSNRTYNNALAFYRTLFNWLVEYNYILVNPFVALKKVPKRLTQKKRTYFERSELKMLVEFLEVENKNYLAACMLCYYCFLRPSDISYLKISNFDFKNNLIKIKGTETKNDKDSVKVIPKALERYLSYICWERITEKDYIFSHNSLFTAGSKQMDSREFSRYWNKVIRPACGFGMDKQFYSLKDSGITNLMGEGVSAGYVQGQADHSSLEITNKYNHTHTPDGYFQIRNLPKEI